MTRKSHVGDKGKSPMNSTSIAKKEAQDVDTVSPSNKAHYGIFSNDSSNVENKTSLDDGETTRGNVETCIFLTKYHVMFL